MKTKLKLQNRLLLAALVAVTVLITACGGGTTTTTTTTCSLSQGTLGQTLGKSLSVGEVTSYTPVPINTVSGCTLSYSTFGALPAGLSISSSTGLVTGAPFTAGTYSTQLTVSTGSATSIGNSLFYTVVFTITKPVTWSVQAANTGLPAGPTSLTSVNGQLYALVAPLSGLNYVPQLWTSTTQGVSWVNTNLTPPNPSGSLIGSGFVTDGNSIYLIGGQSSASGVSPKTYANSVYALTPGASKPAWTTTTNLAFSGGGMAFMGTTFANNTLYVQGGFNSGNSISKKLYGSSNGGVTWIDIIDTNNPQTANQCLVATNDRLLSVGGVTTSAIPGAGFEPSPYVFTTSPPSFSWGKSTSGNIFLNSQNLKCAYLNAKVYTTGGIGSLSTATNAVYVSNDQGTSWVIEPSSANFSGRYGHGMAAQNGRLIVVGGVNSAGVGLSDSLVGTP